ncbi:MAG: hypothetical protein KGL10_05475 [Alphaproteobacteria bacterium]|nr:hypothetical protein [Alphaproteobacteria bacterium]
MTTHDDFIRDLTNCLKNSARSRNEKPDIPPAGGLPVPRAGFNLSSMNRHP